MVRGRIWFATTRTLKLRVSALPLRSVPGVDERHHDTSIPDDEAGTERNATVIHVVGVRAPHDQEESQRGPEDADGQREQRVAAPAPRFLFGFSGALQAARGAFLVGGHGAGAAALEKVESRKLKVEEGACHRSPGER